MMDGVFDGSGNIYIFAIDAMYFGAAYIPTWKLMQYTKSNMNIVYTSETYVASNTLTTGYGSCVITADYLYIYCVTG